MNNCRFTSKEKFMLVLICTSLTIFSYYFIFFPGYGGLSYVDFITQRDVCEYTLKGFDIYQLRGNGNIYMGFHAVPWGCLLGNIFYPGFLPIEEAKIYFIVINVIALIAVSYLLYKKISVVSGELGIAALFMSILSVDFLVSLHLGNGGFIISVFILFAWAVLDEHPYIAGILIGLAMTKPQAAGITCILMLLMKRIKPVVVGAVIDIAAWFAVSVITKTGMIELLREFLFSSDKLAHSWLNAGIFSLLFDNALISISFSMIFGILFVSIIYVFLPNRGGVFQNTLRFTLL